MKRYLSTFLFYKGQLVRNCVVGLDEHFTITEIIPLDSHTTETAHTLFLDGIISGELKDRKPYLPDLNGKKEFLTFFKENTRPIELGKINHIVVWSNISHLEWRFKSKEFPKMLQ